MGLRVHGPLDQRIGMVLLDAALICGPRILHRWIAHVVVEFGQQFTLRIAADQFRKIMAKFIA